MIRESGVWSCGPAGGGIGVRVGCRHAEMQDQSAGVRSMMRYLRVGGRRGPADGDGRRAVVGSTRQRRRGSRRHERGDSAARDCAAYSAARCSSTSGSSGQPTGSSIPCRSRVACLGIEFLHLEFSRGSAACSWSSCRNGRAGTGDELDLSRMVDPRSDLTALARSSATTASTPFFRLRSP